MLNFIFHKAILQAAKPAPSNRFPVGKAFTCNHCKRFFTKLRRCKVWRLNRRASKKTIGKRNGRICTDEHGAYRNPGKEFKAHHAVVHSKYEYVLKTPDGISASTNHCESFFALLKRGVHGAWHNVSREHLPKYVNEFAFRWNTRKLTDGARMAAAIPMIEGKRLTYRQVS
jgi:hypothetical protein